MSSENVTKILRERKNNKLKLVIQGTIIGLIAGLVIVINRLLITKFFDIFKDLYISSSTSFVKSIGVVAFVSILGIIVGFMVRREPMISGSGIPQVKGRVTNKIKMNWARILIYKFLGGVIALSAGLSLGREGPSVQIGASVGEGVGKFFNKKFPVKDEFLITAGASAGLTGAFNAPLSGIIFALEEVHRTFSPLVLLPAMAAALASDFIVKRFLGMDPALQLHNMASLPLSNYWMLIILGIVVGLGGVLFSKGIYFFQYLYSKLKNIPVEFKVMIPFLITAIVGLTVPDLLGGGHELIMGLVGKDIPVNTLVIAFILKLLLLVICFASGVPGGIFLPMLALGALLGDIVGIGACTIFGVPTVFILNFIALGMAGYFAAVVKAPITGIVLITEMTGSFDHLLSLAIVVIIAYLTSELLGNEPIYEVLLEKLLKKLGVKECKDDHNKTLLEFVVEMDSAIENRLIKDIQWPKGCLLVAIKRGEKEIIPNGKTRILGGDYLVVLANVNDSSRMVDEINNLTLVI